MQRIRFGGRDIDFSLEYMKRRSLGIKVHPDTRVEVLAPIAAKEHQIIERIKLKAPWILKQIDRFNSYRPLTPPRRFINGETHLYLGRQYRLKIMQDKECFVKAYRGQLWIHSSDISPKALKKLLDDWYRNKAFIVFNELLKETLPKFRRYKILAPTLIVRSMTKRWGSCTPSGKIFLNTELIKAAKGSIEYVIVHELSHLVYHNHTKAFLNLQSRMLPEWQKWKDRLEYGLA